MRSGIGYDVHRLVPGRSLVLGGVQIAFSHGLDGHSDADVLAHAIMDALLGAAGARDIGHHFPPSDPAYRGASSLALLARVRGILAARGWSVANVDATIIAEAPRLAPYVERMQSNIAAALAVSPQDVGIKATTNEGLGFIGRGEGMAALAVATLTRSA